MTSVDPVTTDPKGEAWRPGFGQEIMAPRNTPALTAVHETPTEFDS
jgi:hypothetical protein